MNCKTVDVRNHFKSKDKNLYRYYFCLDCIGGYQWWRGNCYKFIRRTCTWEQAYQACRQSSYNKGALASISSDSENHYVSQLIQYSNSWIGGTFLRSNRWAWIDGNRWNGYRKPWAAGEPNNWKGNTRFEDKIFMYGKSGRGPFGTWNDDGNRNDGFKVSGLSKDKVTGLVCKYKA